MQSLSKRRLSGRPAASCRFVRGLRGRYDLVVIDRLLRSQRFVLSAAFVALALTGLIAGYMTGGSEAASSLPPAPEPAQTYLRGTVDSLSGDQLTLSTDAGPRSLKLSSSAAVETLRHVQASAIAPGDWLNGGAVRNNQTVFALTAIVIIQQAQLQAGTR
jgi:hypothetical protein